MRQHIEAVRKFMELAGQGLPEKPQPPDEDTRLLRAKLIFEEAMETIERGLGVSVRVQGHLTAPGINVEFLLTQGREPNMEELIDGVNDILVVSTGTALAAGIDPEKHQEAVDEANLRKFSEGGYRSDGTDGNPEGKWIKPPGWTPPNHQELLEKAAE